MAEEGFVRMYVRDFATLAARAETGSDVEEQLQRRLGEARSHAHLMDVRKTGDHLGAISERLRSEAVRRQTRGIQESADPEAAYERRSAFLIRAAELLETKEDQALASA